MSYTPEAMMSTTETVPAARREEGEPLCGRCGYNVRGLPTTSCPECGADLSSAGIAYDSDRRRRRRRLAAVTVAWTVLCPVVGWALTFASMAWLLPFRISERVEREIMATRQGVLVFGVHAKVTGRRWVLGERPPQVFDVPAETISLTIGDRPGSSVLIADWATGAWRIESAGGTVSRHPSGFGPDAIAEWLAAENVTIADPRVRQAAADLHAAVTAMPTPAAQGFTHFAVSGASGAGEPALDITAFPTSLRYDFPQETFYVWAAWALVVIVWAWGLRRLFRRWPPRSRVT
jgi:hypothetical protein